MIWAWHGAAWHYRSEALAALKRAGNGVFLGTVLVLNAYWQREHYPFLLHKCARWKLGYAVWLEMQNFQKVVVHEKSLRSRDRVANFQCFLSSYVRISNYLPALENSSLIVWSTT